MRKILAIAVSVVLFGLAPGLLPQVEDPVVAVECLISRQAVAPGETFKAAVILKIRAGYHINDHAPLDEFMIPTTLTIDDHPDLALVETFFPQGRPARFSYSEMEMAVYEGEVVLGVLLKARASASPGPKTLEASVGYQACDDSTCLPPKEIAFSFAVPVAAAGGAEVHAEVFDKLRFRSLRK